MQTINTLTVSQAKQIHRKKRSANKLCNTNRYREQLTRHVGTHMGMWRHRQTGRQTETHNHFSTNPLTQHSHFTVIMVLWTLNSAECQKRAKQTVLSDLLWSSKPSKATQPSFSPEAASTLLNLPTCHHKLVTYPKTPCCEMGLKKALTMFFLYLLLVFVCVCVWLNRPLTLRLRAAKCRARKSHYRAHKKVIERNVLSSFCQNLPTLELRVSEVWILRSTLLWTRTRRHSLQLELTLTPTTTRCLFNDCGGASLPLKIQQRKKNNIYHFQLPLPL